MSERESMKETVIFDGRTGSVLAIMGECDTEHVEALVIDVPDGMRVDSVDVSGEEPQPIMSETPASLQMQLNDAIARSDKLRSELKVEMMQMINEVLKGEEEE